MDTLVFGEPGLSRRTDHNGMIFGCEARMTRYTL